MRKLLLGGLGHSSLRKAWSWLYAFYRGILRGKAYLVTDFESCLGEENLLHPHSFCSNGEHVPMNCG